MFFSRTTWPISMKFGKKHPQVKGLEFYKKIYLIKKKLIFFLSLNRSNDIIIASYEQNIDAFIEY